MKYSLPKLLSAACLMLWQTHAFGQSYHSNDLTPAGSSSGKLSGASNGKQVGTATVSVSGYSHAMLLSGNALAVTDLNPVNYYYSTANCADDFQQGGWGYGLSGGMHALVWNGSSSSYADLNPSGYMFSSCLGVHNGEQCGYAQNQSYFVTASHAMSWHGSAASCVDLHPIGTTYPFSKALGCHDGEEVGYVSTVAYPEGDYPGYQTANHAMKWNGTAASAVDLHPTGYDASAATCTSGTQQGGWAYIALGTSHQHAMLWSGDAASALDLHPAGYTDSKVTAITPTQQVGEGWVGPAYGATSTRHALLWSGDATSVVDLNQYLPAGYTNAAATGIDASGNVVGYAYNGAYYTAAIAVVFAPGAPAPTQLASIVLAPANAVPLDPVQCTISLGGIAPIGGVNISFLSMNTALLTTPASVVIPEGASNATFTIVTGGATLTTPASVKLYATDGSVSSATSLTLTPIVKLATVSVNPVEGGFATYGTLSLNIPAQFGGATVSLTIGNTSLAAVPATITVPQGYASWSFSVNTAPVTVATTVPITASFNGTTASGSVNLSPAPVVSLVSLSGPDVVGGQPMPVTVTLNNFPRASAGAVISLTSADTATLQVPTTVTVPYGAFSATVNATTVVVPGRKGVTLKATYNGSTLTTTVFVDPIPTVTITQADYLTDLQMFKVQATTTYTNAVLTYGGDPNSPPLGTMQFEAGVFKGSMILATAPTRATVWNSLGGQATVPVTSKLSGGGGGGGGGGGTSTTYKLTIVTNGKGTVTASPAAASYAAGTVVTLTATPAAGSPWIGWSGAITGTKNPATVTINANTSVTANFR
ncbi:MAG: hypothetical protein HY043_08690 [Verrucomicrobia bacterium]|nr:hypothetical protein [Verrucomicrobiota bacterium]